jgi:transcriptional regulator with XRE-family HTH domain
VKKEENSINERIKHIRRVLKLSQVRFAQGIYLSNGYFAEIELGNRRANKRILELIIARYGANRYWLETGEGQMFDKTVDVKLEQLIGFFHELNPRFQDFLFEVLHKLIKLQKKARGKTDARED